MMINERDEVKTLKYTIKILYDVTDDAELLYCNLQDKLTEHWSNKGIDYEEYMELRKFNRGVRDLVLDKHKTRRIVNTIGLIVVLVYIGILFMR